MKNRISNLLANGKSTPILVGVGAIGVGVTCIYIFNRRKNRSVFSPEVFFTDEKEYILDVENETQETMIEEVIENDIEVPTINVFMAPNDDDWNYELELEQRNPDVPYVIHADEYINDEMGFKQETITYYETDDIMADIQDTPLYNWYSITGELKWGHGSKDKNVVYIRNEKMRKEYEVLRHYGSFEAEVTGLDLRGGELKHSILKFRDD